MAREEVRARMDCEWAASNCGSIELNVLVVTFGSFGVDVRILRFRRVFMRYEF